MNFDLLKLEKEVLTMRGEVRKRGKNWYYRFDMGIVDGERQRVEKVVGPDKKEAERALREAISNYESTGMYFEPSTITMADFMDYCNLIARL